MQYRRIVLSVIAVTALAQTAETHRDWLNRGVQAFKNGNFDQATEAFERAVSLNPNDPQTRLYSATVFLSRWVPGVATQANAEFAKRAQEEFEGVLRLEPSNMVALASLASLAFQQASPMRDPLEKMRKLEEAADWNQRILAIDANNKPAHYMLGVIAWSKFYPELMSARARLGMKPETPGPLHDFNVRQDLRSRFGTIVDEGIRHLEKALELDSSYDDAMAYMNLLVRERGDLRDTAEEYQHDVRLAEEWVQKALEIKRAKAAQRMPGGGVPAAPRPLNAGGGQSAKLVSKVDPHYPEMALKARIQGSVQLRATIGKDGRVQNITILSGHPLLVPSAVEAVKQWVYEPPTSNSEMVTDVVVPFFLR